MAENKYDCAVDYEAEMPDFLNWLDKVADVDPASVEAAYLCDQFKLGRMFKVIETEIGKCVQIL